MHKVAKCFNGALSPWIKILMCQADSLYCLRRWKMGYFKKLYFGRAIFSWLRVSSVKPNFSLVDNEKKSVCPIFRHLLKKDIVKTMVTSSVLILFFVCVQGVGVGVIYIFSYSLSPNKWILVLRPVFIWLFFIGIRKEKNPQRLGLTIFLT